VTAGRDERASSEGAAGGARAEDRLLAGSGFPREGCLERERCIIIGSFKHAINRIIICPINLFIKSFFARKLD